MACIIEIMRRIAREKTCFIVSLYTRQQNADSTYDPLGRFCVSSALFTLFILEEISFRESIVFTVDIVHKVPFSIIG